LGFCRNICFCFDHFDCCGAVGALVDIESFVKLGALKVLNSKILAANYQTNQ
jgi:hypothetical protein